MPVVFEKKVFGKTYMEHACTGKWWRSHTDILNNHFQRPDTVEKIKKEDLHGRDTTGGNTDAQ